MDIISYINRQSSEQAGSSLGDRYADICSVPDTEWSRTRRDHFFRQAVDGFFQLARQFYKLYSAHVECLVLKKEFHKNPQHLEMVQAWKLLLHCASSMVGTERCHGPLWRLKDLCHRIWPQDNRVQQQVNGVLIDWLIGSLFHQAMKLKEDLYLLSNYGSGAIAIDGTAERGGERLDRVQVMLNKVNTHVLFGRDALEISRQVERLGGLFGKVNYHLRMMLPELMENVLVVRLLTEREEEINELWGEPLESLFEDVFAGQAAVGFCLAGASYLRGQWFHSALAMYKRARSGDQYCQEAIIKVAQIEAILRGFDLRPIEKRQLTNI